MVDDDLTVCCVAFLVLFLVGMAVVGLLLILAAVL